VVANARRITQPGYFTEQSVSPWTSQRLTSRPKKEMGETTIVPIELHDSIFRAAGPGRASRKGAVRDQRFLERSGAGYRGLLPGVYVLFCHCDVGSAPGDRDQISIAVAAIRLRPFSRQSFTVSVGINALKHVLEIPAEPDRLPSDIEFRIAKRTGVDVTVNRLETKLTGST
jgi:hypothetical protein